jgi:hypothetical protein
MGRQNNNSNQGVIVAGIFTIAAALIAGFFAIVQPFIADNLAKQPTKTPAPTQYTIPTVGANQGDFSPNLPLGTKIQDVPRTYDLIPGRFTGIYISEVKFNSPSYSWKVFYQNGKFVPAESVTCLINKGSGGSMQSPLNRVVNDMDFEVSVFTDYRYSYTLSGMDVLINSYEPARTDVDYLEIELPGAGGMDTPFKTIRTDKVKINHAAGLIYKIDFPDFTLQPNQGVNILVPVLFVDDGSFQFQVKINGLGLPEYKDDPGGNLTLTTGQMDYGWARIQDPRQYSVKVDPALTDGTTPQPVNLVLCP